MCIIIIIMTIIIIIIVIIIIVDLSWPLKLDVRVKGDELVGDSKLMHELKATRKSATRS